MGIYGFTYPQLPQATALTGDELIAVNQNGLLKRTTVAEIGTTATSALAVTVLAPGAGIDASNIVQTAINTAISTGIKRVYFGPGIFWFPVGSTPLNPGTGDIDFIGSGKNSTILKWAEGSSTVINDPNWHPLFKNTSASLKGIVNFQDIQFQGTLVDALAGGYGFINTGGPGFYMEHFQEVNFNNCRFYGISCFTMQFEWVYDFSVVNCEFDTCMRDQVRYRSSFNGIVAGCHFKHSDDDSVALHQASYVQGDGTIHEGFIVIHNIFEDTTAVHCLGARLINVSNNVFRRCKLGAVRIERDAGEGMNPMFGITIANNIASDTLARPPFSGVASTVYAVNCNIPRAGSGTPTLFPGANNSAAPAMTPPWPYFNNDSTDTADAMPPGYGVKVSGNTTMRTLPAVSAYSDWGFGECLSNTGFVDPAVTDAALRPTAGATFSTNIVGLDISKNNIFNNTRGISLSDNTVKGLARGSISGNNIYDCPEYGVVFFGDGTYHMVVSDNDICLDPYHLSAGRNADGSWTNSYFPSVGIFGSGSAVGIVARDNTFAECYQPISLTNALVQRNTVKCFAFATGYSSSNIGVGNIPAAGEGFTHIRVLSDTSSTNLNILGQAPVIQASAQPSTGFFNQGQAVRNTNLALPVAGWLRLTTNSNNVDGTDWITYPIQGGAIAISGNTTLTNFQEFVNTNTGSAVTVTLPPSPVNGQRHTIRDVTGGAAANNISIAGNGKNINGSASATISTNYASLRVEYIQAQNIWYIT